MTARYKKRIPWRNGFSLVEVIAAIAVLSLAFPAASLMSTASLLADNDVNRSTAAFFLANNLMSEISERAFWVSPSFPGNTAYPADINGYSRAAFQGVGEYNIFTTTWGAQTPPRDENGNQLMSYAAYSQLVNVVNVNPPDLNGAARAFTAVADGSTNFKLVTITIAWNGGKSQYQMTKVFALP